MDATAHACVLTCVAPAGSAGVLEFSPDLTHWGALQPFTNVTGVIELREPMNTNVGSRFFRVRQVAPLP